MDACSLAAELWSFMCPERLACVAVQRPLRRLLSHWIPHPGVVSAFAEKGVRELYPW